MCNNGHVKNFYVLSKKALVTRLRFSWVRQELKIQALVLCLALHWRIKSDKLLLLT